MNPHMDFMENAEISLKQILLKDQGLTVSCVACSSVYMYESYINSCKHTNKRSHNT